MNFFACSREKFTIIRGTAATRKTTDDDFSKHPRSFQEFAAPMASMKKRTIKIDSIGNMFPIVFFFLIDNKMSSASAVLFNCVCSNFD